MREPQAVVPCRRKAPLCKNAKRATVQPYDRNHNRNRLPNALITDYSPDRIAYNALSADHPSPIAPQRKTTALCPPAYGAAPEPNGIIP